MQENSRNVVSSNEKFSVLMSVYNGEKIEYLDNSLKSILIDQIRKPDEFVIICDGKLTQGLDKVISSYKQRFPKILKIYRLRENKGLGRALRAGLMKCSYDIVARADSDDICASNRFQVQLAFLESHKDISVVSSYIYEFNDDWERPCRRKELPLRHEEIVKMAKYRNPINHMAVMFRREAILSVGSYRHVAYMEDYDLWVRAIVKGYKFANIDQCLVYARIGNGMVIRRGNRQQIKSWNIVSKYMLKNRMINYIEYYRNMISVIGFVYMFSGTKELMYKFLLRKS